MEGILPMSQKEVDRIGGISSIEQNDLTAEEVAELAKLSNRQVYRILK